MTKTPVSVLQEYMQKGALGMPHYEIISTGNIHVPSFTYRVSCCRLFAQGTASTKKEAKHNAAKEMLKLLCDGSSLNSSSSSSSSSPKSNSTDSYYSPKARGISQDDIFVNSVGKLAEHCTSRNFKPPEYTELGSSGPCHLPQFTIRCSIGSLSAHATGPTKKQAKHDAAQNMYQLLLKSTTSKTNVDLYENALQQSYLAVEREMAKVEIMDIRMPELPISSTKSSERAMELFPKLRPIGSANIVKDVPIDAYHEALKNSVRPLTRTSAQSTISSSTQVLNYETLLANALKILGLQFDATISKSRNGLCVFRCTVNSSPHITEMGVSKSLSEAKQMAFGRMLKSVELFLR